MNPNTWLKAFWSSWSSNSVFEMQTRAVFSYGHQVQQRSKQDAQMKTDDKQPQMTH